MAGRYTNTVALCCGVAAAAIAAPAHAGSYKVLYSFQGGADGSGPSPLIQAGEKLYGATILGGASNAGTVFSIDLKTGTETVLYSFAGGSDAANPMAGLIAIGDELYGTTSFGGGTGCGGDGCGTVYAIKKKTGAEKIVYAFQGGNDGRFPAASLLRKGAALFGATEFGGGSTQCEWGCGTVFSLTLKTGAESVLFAFANPITGGPSGG